MQKNSFMLFITATLILTFYPLRSTENTNPDETAEGRSTNAPTDIISDTEKIQYIEFFANLGHEWALDKKVFRLASEEFGYSYSTEQPHLLIEYIGKLACTGISWTLELYRFEAERRKCVSNPEQALNLIEAHASAGNSWALEFKAEGLTLERYGYLSSRTELEDFMNVAASHALLCPI